MAMLDINCFRLPQIILILILRREKIFSKPHLLNIFVRQQLWKIQPMILNTLTHSIIPNIFVLLFNIQQNYIQRRLQKLTKQQIIKYWKQLQNSNSIDKAGRSKFHFRLVSDEMAFNLSGYEFNGITPFCMKEEMPLLVSAKIKELDFFWFGGGHKDIKLRMKLDEIATKLGDQIHFSDIIYDS